jgi:hypothetical protein
VVVELSDVDETNELLELVMLELSMISLLEGRELLKVCSLDEETTSLERGSELDRDKSIELELITDSLLTGEELINDDSFDEIFPLDGGRLDVLSTLEELSSLLGESLEELRLLLETMSLELLMGSLDWMMLDSR